MRLSKSLKQLITNTARDAYAKGVADGERKVIVGLKAVAQLNGSFGAVAPLAGFARKAEPDDTHALLVSAMLQVAEGAADTGDDPADALRALADLSQDPDRLRDILTGPQVPESGTSKLVQKSFDESLHPRDKAGRFISKEKLQAAKSDPKLAAELRDRVAPKDADKLEAVLSGDKDPGRTRRGEARHQARQRRAATESDRKRAHRLAMRAFEPGGLGYDDYEELAELLPSLTVEQLRAVRSAVGASWGGQKLKRQGMVDTLVAFARQQSATVEQDAPGSPEWQARMMNREPQPKPGVDAWESAKVDDAADRAERMGAWESDRPESEAAGVVAGAARADLAGAKEWAGDVAVTTPKPAAEVEPQAPPEEKPVAPGLSPLNTASPYSLAARDGDRRGHLGRVLAAAGALAPQDALDYATADGDRRVTAAQAEIILSNRLGLGTAAAARAVLATLKPVGTTVVGGGRKRPTYDVLDLFRAVGKLAEPAAGNNPESGHTPSPPVNSPVAGQSGPDTGGEPNGRGQRLSDEVRGGAGGRGGAGVGAGDGPSPGDAPRPPGGSPTGEPAPAGGRPGNRGAGGGPGGGRPGGVAAGGAGAGGGPGGRGPAGGTVPPADGPGGGGGPGRADGGGEVALPALTAPTPYGPQAVVSRGGLVVRDGTGANNPVGKPVEPAGADILPSGGMGRGVDPVAAARESRRLQDADRKKRSEVRRLVDIALAGGQWTNFDVADLVDAGVGTQKIRQYFGAKKKQESSGTNRPDGGDAPTRQEPAPATLPALTQPTPYGPQAVAPLAGFAKAVHHAPAGGVTVQGKEYAGGEFIPGAVMARATAAEKAAVAGGKPDGGRTAAGRRTRDDGSPVAGPKGWRAARREAEAAIRAAPVPPPEQVEKVRGKLDAWKAACKAARAAGEPKPRLRAYYDARGGSAAHRARARRLFLRHGGGRRGYVVCHGTGRKLHWTTDPAENPHGYPKFEQGKVFVAAQGGGYADANVLPEHPSYNRLRGNARLRPENSDDLAPPGGPIKAAARMTAADYAAAGWKPRQLSDVARAARRPADGASVATAGGWVGASAGLPDAQRAAYIGHMADVLTNLPPPLRAAAEAGVDPTRTTFHPDLAALRGEYAARKRGKPPAGLCGFVQYTPAGPALHIDGGTEDNPKAAYATAGTYAHELAHVVDRDGVYSGTKEWQAAWKRDIIKGKTALSGYALEDPSEGFAELVRGLYEYGPDAVRLLFPACARFLDAKGLL